MQNGGSPWLLSRAGTRQRLFSRPPTRPFPGALAAPVPAPVSALRWQRRLRLFWPVIHVIGRARCSDSPLVSGRPCWTGSGTAA
jgi:hypothetical protein